MMNHRHRVLQYIVFIGIILSSTDALSQSEEQDTSYWNIKLENVVVTAQYAPTSTKNAIHEVKVLKARELKAKGYNSLDEALRNQVNMRINTDPILGNGLEIQGIGGQHIKVMVDGVPVIGRLNGNIDLSQIQLNDIERIEIVEGALSTNYGSNASGGVVNIITKKSIPESLSIQGEILYESVGIWNNQLNIAGSYKGFTARIGGNYYRSQFAPIDSLRVFNEVDLPDGNSRKVRKIPWNPKDQFGAHASLHYNFSDSLKISYNFRYFDEVVHRYGEVRRPQFKPYAFNKRFHTGRQDHNVRLETYLNKRWYLKSLTAFNRYNRLSEKNRENFETDSLFTLPEESDTTVFYAFLHRSMLSYISDTDWNGLMGVEYQHEGGIGERIVDTTSASVNETSLSNLALWTSLRYNGIKNLKVQASLRYGYNSAFQHPLLLSVHLSWKFIPQWNVKLSYAHGYRAPALKELHYQLIDINHYIIGNPDLEAENSMNLSGILTYSADIYAESSLEMQVKGFYNSIKNIIVLAQYEQLRYTYQNISKFGTHGLNASATLDWRENLELKATFGFRRSLSDIASNYVNQIELQNSLTYNPPAINLTFYASHKYVGNQQYFYLDNEENVRQGSIGSYNYLDASAKYAFLQEQIYLAMGVKNLLDVTAVPITGTSQSVHSSLSSQQTLNWGRSYFVKLGVSLR